MSEFTSVLTHGRRLQGAVKELSVEELESVQQKLSNIIDKRKEQEQELAKAQQEKLAKLEEIKKQMTEAGIDITDLQDIGDTRSKRKTGKKRPVKYRITKNGETTSWTGVGRMPVVFKEVLENGQSLEDFAV
ncbi:MAG: H-NS histone family protein [Alteromonadaceae bacterium]|nr:H-NS histone family protein [Alteromonadaceae bacterium]